MCRVGGGKGWRWVGKGSIQCEGRRVAIQGAGMAYGAGMWGWAVV